MIEKESELKIQKEENFAKLKSSNGEEERKRCEGDG